MSIHLDVRAEVEAMIQRVQQAWTHWALEQGETRGQLQARRETLREQLEERFGPLPKEIVQRIETLSELDRLSILLRQVVHIQSLDELHHLKQTWCDWMMERGEARGRLEAKRDILRVQLEERFGPLSEEVVRKIDALSDLDQLKALLQRVVHIQSLDELQL